jgi:rhodanese-related sulfurtransferase
MKNKIRLTALMFFICIGAFAQAPYTTDKELQMTAATLNLRITQNKNIPVILNVGEEGKIKGSLQVGVMKEKKDTDLLLKLKGVDKKQEVVIYCGCCTLENCENIEKAFNILKKNGYTNVKALNLGDGYGPGWQGTGYPVEK